jgi:hypothetical protein
VKRSQRQYTPASPEGAEHAIRSACPGALIAVGRCRCGITEVIVCTGCGLPVLFTTKRGQWCSHAQALREAS